ncbi:MAG TPA: PEP-CTERM sorting domain-containing protein [Pirellulales bacterium]|jgi:hypothetical protein|nr:PEP-CTERM sorting domain-containing protein [Pirellulales bacterium]
MNRMMKTMLAATIVGAFAASAWAQDTMILSTSNTNPLYGDIIGRQIGQAAFTAPLYVWVTANTGDEIAPQSLGFTNETINGNTNPVPNSAAGMGLTYTVSGQTLVPGFSPPTANVFLLNGASMYNPSLGNVTFPVSAPTTRWDNVTTITAGSISPTSSIADVNAIGNSVALSGATPPVVTSDPASYRGLENVNAGATLGAGKDPQSLTIAGVSYFLAGEVDLSVTGFGTANLAISEGNPAIAQGATDIGPNGGANAKYTLGSTSVRVALAGDANLNGTTDLGDINLITNVANWQKPGTWGGLNGDVNGDGQVNLGDINIVTNVANWQKSIVGSSSISGVPEPASFVLLGLGTVALLVRSRRKNVA